MSHDPMTVLGGTLDEMFSGGARGAERKTGFMLLVFPIGETRECRCNCVSNVYHGDPVTLMKEVIARFEGQPELEGRA
jgi:hypothetical protein